MTVKELITKLQTLPSYANIAHMYADAGFVSVVRVESVCVNTQADFVVLYSHEELACSETNELPFDVEHFAERD